MILVPASSYELRSVASPAPSPVTFVGVSTQMRISSDFLIASLIQVEEMRVRAFSRAVLDVPHNTSDILCTRFELVISAPRTFSNLS